VVTQLNELPDSVIFIEGVGLPTLLHTVAVTHADKSMEDVLVIGAPTYTNLDPTKLVDPNHNHFAYTLDCSGYINAEIQASATVPGSDMTAKAASSLTTQNSMFVGSAIVISPLYAAYYGSSSGIILDTATRIAVLKAIVNDSNDFSATDVITLTMSYQVVWVSNTGNQNFNGSADLTAKGGLGIGMAQISGSASGGGTISRSSTFSSFDTYLTGNQILNKPGLVTLASINDVITKLGGK